ncbi:hypothetical protein [Desulfovibrio litoralis]|uniref:Uncharacterized protein n=1 Tax=Desulfovibrio litoralis DSM 11393 TaxID=1121455 RepID=A0A1M7RS39_9BACT|nr:hypothetical protein [Desulfovibrio litoralis]SHN49021.1 hypothetical protein SAMN02745728_00087 [Desulfovibrio litoralis DSM 11393]
MKLEIKREKSEYIRYCSTSLNLSYFLLNRACYLVQYNNIDAIYNTAFLSLKKLRDNSLFIRFFNCAKKQLSNNQIMQLASLFIIDKSVSQYYSWLEKNPFLLFSIIELQHHKNVELLELLNIKIIDKKSDCTLICFASRNEKINELNYQLTDILSVYNYNLIFVRDMYDAWYLKGLAFLTNDVPDTVLYLRKKINELEKESSNIFTIGCSSGGYASLLFGYLLGAKRIIAFAPQTLLPRPLPLPDVSCLNGVDQTYFDLLTSLDWQSLNANIALFYSQEYERDKIACERLKNVHGVELHPFVAGKEHNIAGWLKKNNLLRSSIDKYLKSDLGNISQHLVSFPNTPQSFFLFFYTPILKLIAKPKYYKQFKDNPNNFFADTESTINKIFLKFLELFGPKAKR